MKRMLAALLLAAAGAAQGAGTWAAFFATSGAALEVDYVRLEGVLPAAQRASQRDTLLLLHEVCAQGREGRGPVRALSAAELPEHPYREEVEIYYAGERSLVVRDMVRYAIDQGPPNRRAAEAHAYRGDCGLRREHVRELIYMHGEASCKVGQRGSDARATPACRHLGLVGGGRGAAVDRTRPEGAGFSPASPPPGVDPALWASLAGGALGQAQAMLGASGEHRSVRGQRCEVYGRPQVVEVCLQSGARRAGFSALNPVQPGLLLSARSPALDLDAVEVAEGVKVAEALFRVPVDAAGRVEVERLPPAPR